jgi:hypothetical protein
LLPQKLKSPLPGQGRTLYANRKAGNPGKRRDIPQVFQNMGITLSPKDREHVFRYANSLSTAFARKQFDHHGGGRLTDGTSFSLKPEFQRL